MKIDTQPRDDHQVTMTVELDSEKLESARRKAARKIAGRVKIPGFRPGKAPYDVVRRYYGDASITEEAVEILVDEVYPEALKEADIKPAAAGSLESIENLDPPVFKFTVPLQPEVALGDYKNIRHPYKFDPPGNEKVDEALDELRRMYSTTENVDREVQEGDFVLVDIQGETKIKEGEEAPDFDRNGFPVMVRKDEKADEWPFPGFSTRLAGMKPDEEKSFDYKFAKDYSFETLKGKSVRFTVKVKSVRGVTLPELNDEFAKMVGGGDTLEELRERMNESIVRQAQADYDDAYFVELLAKIKEGTTLKYPPQVLEHESEHVLDELKRRLTEQGLEFDAYLKMRETDMEKFLDEEVRPVAIRRLERSMLLDELARVEKIELDEESLGEAFNESWSMLSATDENFQKATRGGKKASKELIDAVAVDAANRLIVSRVLDRIKAIASGDMVEESEVEEKPKKKSTRKASETGEKKASKKTKKESAPEGAEDAG